ncbi:hypothetical protein [Streptomyces sp. NPDC053069]|uniref:hypothetical protein n=1 Tax=Streptomyces sp. NPDC053069 TaxID=3365695 RepID=UPI0037D0FBEA
MPGVSAISGSDMVTFFGFDRAGFGEPAVMLVAAMCLAVDAESDLPSSPPHCVATARMSATTAITPHPMAVSLLPLLLPTSDP